MKVDKKAITGMLLTAGAFAVGLLVAEQIKKRVTFFNSSGDFMMASGSRTGYRENFR
tara:strand:- start:808 stop:978 length:171 start_codon:yes stop_codon:yes gene_type:complete